MCFPVNKSSGAAKRRAFVVYFALYSDNEGPGSVYMVICVFGESCTGKTTIAGALNERLGATTYTGKDYLKLAKNEPEAGRMFAELLKLHEKSEDIIIYVVSEKELLSFLPAAAIRVLATAGLNVIKERFAKRMNGTLPIPVATMLEKRHGMFDNEKHDLHIIDDAEPINSVCEKIIHFCNASLSKYGLSQHNQSY